MAQVAPEIRFRVDTKLYDDFQGVAEHVGLDANEMIKVFMRRAISAGGFPFEMRARAPDIVQPSERNLPIHGASVSRLAETARRAAQAAADRHVAAGRLDPAPVFEHTR